MSRKTSLVKSITGYGESVTGRRQNNQDCFMAAPELGLWVLCDGMGGHQAGAEASRLATEIMVRQVKEE